VSPDECQGGFGEFVTCHGGALQHLPRNVFGHVTAPVLVNVEGDDAKRSAVLPTEEIADDRLAIRFGLVGFDEGDAVTPEVVLD
jgi:hypothetical protein